MGRELATFCLAATILLGAGEASLAETGSDIIGGDLRARTGNDSPVNVGGEQYVIHAKTVSLGYPIEQHERVVKDKDREITAVLERLLEQAAEASEQHRKKLQNDIDRLLAEKKDAEDRLLDLRASYEAHTREMATLRAKLDGLEGSFGAERIEAAQAALSRGETGRAYAIFAEVAEIESGNLERAADAIFHQGLIAEGEIDWERAARHYRRAADVFPSYERLRKAAELAEKNVEISEAIRYAELAVELATKEFGTRSEIAAEAKSELADYYRSAARYRDAEASHLEALAISEGVETARRGRILAAYASWLLEVGRYVDAEDVLTDALTLTRDAPAVPDKERAELLALLAEVQRGGANYEAASTSLERAVALVREAPGLGPRHPDHLEYRNDLVYVLHDRGHYREAETLARDNLREASVILGEEHPKMADFFSAVGHAIYDRPSEALEFVEDAVEISKTSLGRLHPGYAVDLGNYAGVLSDLGKYEDAEREFGEALKILERTLGRDHRTYISIANNYGNLLSETGRSNDSLNLYRDLVALRRAAVGEIHPDYALSLVNLTFALTETGGFEEALTRVDEAIDILDLTVGPNHRLTISAFSQKATILVSLGRAADAEGLARLAVELAEEVLGKRHGKYAMAFANLGAALFHQGKYSEAIEPFMKARAALADADQVATFNYIRITSNIGAAHGNLWEHEKAIQFLEEANSLAKAHLGETHSQYAISLTSLGMVLRATNRLDQAEETLETAVAAFEAGGPDLHPTYYLALNNLGVLLQRTDRSPEAAVILKKALAAFVDLYGEDHPNYRLVAGNLALALSDDERELKRTLHEKALASARRNLEASPDGYVLALQNLASHLADDGELARSGELMREAIEALANGGLRDPELLANMFANAGRIERRLGRISTAKEHFLRSLAIYQQQLGPADPRVHSGIFRLAGILDDNSDTEFAEKEALLGEIINADTAELDTLAPARLTAMNNLAFALSSRGETTRAEEMYRKILLMEEIAGRQTSRDHALHLRNLAQLLADTGSVDEAESLLSKAVELELGSDADAPNFSTASLYQLATLYADTDRIVEGRAAFDAALDEFPSDSEPRDRHLSLLKTYANWLDRRDLSIDAVPVQLAAYTLSAEIHGTDAEETIEALVDLGAQQTNAEAHVDALATANQAVALARASLGENNSLFGRSHYYRCRSLGKAEQFDEAARACRTSVEFNSQIGGAYGFEATFSKKYLSIALANLGKVDEAKRILTDSWEKTKEKHGEDSWMTKDLEKHLTELIAEHFPEESLESEEAE